MIVGGNLANFMSYVYHLILGRILGPASYGDLVATLSLIAIIMSIINFFGLVIVKFVSSASNKNIPNILGWFNRKVIPISIVLSILIWVASPYIGEFVRLPKNISILFAPILFFSILAFVYKSFLQGTLKFKENAIISNVELTSRLILALVFVFLGMSVFGASLGILGSVICSMLLSKYFLRNIGFVNKEVDGFNWRSVFFYAMPVFLVSISYTSLLTSDFILVKHYFSSYDAGIYGSVSNLGKIIFYGTAPIGSVMFPIIAKRKSLGNNFMSIFFISITLVFLIGIGVLVLYYLFPSILVRISYSGKFADGSKYLLLMGVYYILFSLANLFSSFLLSIDIIKPVILLPLFALIQVFAICLFHTSIWWVIGASISSISLLLIYLGLYFVYARAKIS